MDDEKLKPVWVKLDEYGSKINELDKSVNYSHLRHDTAERDAKNLCKQLTETRQEIVSSITTLTATVATLQSAKDQEIGARNATRQNITWLIKLIEVSPYLVIGFGAIYAYLAHK